MLRHFTKSLRSDKLLMSLILLVIIAIIVIIALSFSGYYNLKKDNNETIEKQNINLSSYSIDINKDKKRLIEEENKVKSEVFNQIKEYQDIIFELKNELSKLKDKYGNLKKISLNDGESYYINTVESDSDIEKQHSKLNYDILRRYSGESTEKLKNELNNCTNVIDKDEK